jgi:hypothetical protein
MRHHPNFKETIMKNSNCAVLQTGDKPSDHSHVERATPIATKLKELADDKKYRTELNVGINETRQSHTTRLRRQNINHVKPL